MGDARLFGKKEEKDPGPEREVVEAEGEGTSGQDQMQPWNGVLTWT